MLALYSILSGTYYAQNYISIIGGSLAAVCFTHFAKCRAQDLGIQEIFGILAIRD